MRDLRKYWQEVRAIERDLPEFVWIVNSGTLVEVPAAQAAKMLHGGAYRVATEEEIEAHKAAEQTMRTRAFHDDLRRRGIAVVALGSEDKKK
jgi:hypothetical protein